MAEHCSPPPETSHEGRLVEPQQHADGEGRNLRCHRDTTGVEIVVVREYVGPHGIAGFGVKRAPCQSSTGPATPFGVARDLGVEGAGVATELGLDIDLPRAARTRRDQRLQLVVVGESTRYWIAEPVDVVGTARRRKAERSHREFGDHRRSIGWGGAPPARAIAHGEVAQRRVRHEPGNVDGQRPRSHELEVLAPRRPLEGNAQYGAAVRYFLDSFERTQQILGATRRRRRDTEATETDHDACDAVQI